MLNNNNTDLFEELKKGYREMADINSDLAEEAVLTDNEALGKYEDSLVNNL